MPLAYFLAPESVGSSTWNPPTRSGCGDASVGNGVGDRVGVGSLDGRALEGAWPGVVAVHAASVIVATIARTLKRSLLSQIGFTGFRRSSALTLSLAISLGLFKKFAQARSGSGVSSARGIRTESEGPPSLSNAQPLPCHKQNEVAVSV